MSAPTVKSLSWDDSRLLVESVVDYAILMLDAEGRVTTWNRGAEAIKGYRADEIVGQHFSRFYGDQDNAAGKPARALAVASAQGRVEDEGWRLRKDGTRFWASVVITALRNEEGVLLGYAKVTRDLSARRRDEEELRRSEERFRLLVENVGDYAIYVLDAGGHVTTWNLGAQRLKGYEATEAIGMHFSAFFPAEDAAGGKPARELAIAREHGRFEEEGWRIRKDGTRFWANVVLTVLHDSQGTEIGFAKITRDLTARKEAEETDRRLAREQAAREAAEHAERRIRDSEEKYRALSQRLEIVFDGVADGISVQDATGQIVFANSAAARFCGFSTAAELTSASTAQVAAMFEIFDESGRPLPGDRLPGRLAMAGQGPNSCTVRIRERASRRERWVLLRASAILSPVGEPDLAINIWHDITSERRREQQSAWLADATAALGQSLDTNEMLGGLARTLVPSLGDWGTIHLLEGDHLRRVTVAHPDPVRREQALTNEPALVPRDEANGMWTIIESGRSETYNDISDDMLSSAARDPAHLATLRAAGMKAVLLAPIQLRGKVIGVLTLVAAESERRYEPSDVALVEEIGRRAGVALDNAQLYRAAQEAVKAAEDASRAKDEFLATVSHELRTPLSAILGWAALLTKTVTDPTVTKGIDVIHRNALAQVRIIDDILDVSRVVTGKLRIDARPTDLVSIARDAIEVVRPSADAKQIELTLLNSGPCILVGDADRLRQVVWNLLSNSVKFTDRGGAITVRVGYTDSSVLLSITDTGRGIDPAFLPHVFDRFRQADASMTRRVGGLGLGLALVRHIVELHGGRVRAQSSGVGHGSTFSITLPVRAVFAPHEERRTPAPHVPKRAEPTVASLANVRIVVVDDEADARELLATVLGSAGALVTTAASAQAGFEEFQRLRPDVLLSDIGMPDEDGFSLVRRIRALPADQGGQTPAIALTAFARDEDRAAALAAGFTMHVGKPVDPTALTAAVVSVVPTRPER